MYYETHIFPKQNLPVNGIRRWLKGRGLKRISKQDNGNSIQFAIIQGSIKPGLFFNVLIKSYDCSMNIRTVRHLLTSKAATSKTMLKITQINTGPQNTAENQEK